ncbi:undecaprenyl pyrophosphate synthetase [Tanticharoenia sakaeratensis NBRC 103193]|uniref:Isoprenyl transferase n=2 Tax=Tanticharoenia TaxID=444052 RepID=A0A0D6MKT8_9PROT|nr:polyprenyl diphosphate synthase [Tanticharoenia sakaeratensis]GAN54269.1 undecaprenyl pyrophosphate synthetase [Tanticharoenia sakaeratensis NBRC 103193]GBQ19099.1 undecaprenyl pyrophosphate synthetase [Tanticharoenia sakaeratensis NBRC 103193]
MSAGPMARTRFARREKSERPVVPGGFPLAGPRPAVDGGGAVPAHVALIMDGNGRWARARGLPPIAGHRAGAEAVRHSVTAAIEHGVQYLTLYAFSSENWRRPPREVGDLTSLLRFYLRHKLQELHEQGVRLRAIGELERFEPALREELERAEALTARNTRLTLTLALSYGGRAEIARAAMRLAELVRDGLLAPEQIDEERLAGQLSTDDIPDPDLVVRTSGECRLSNFLLWQSAYAELMFVDTLWPDFDAAAFGRVLADYARRERRFGGR